METIQQITLDAHLAGILHAALMSGESDYYHPEVESSHPYFDERIHTLKLDELNTLHLVLDEQVTMNQTYAKILEKNIKWEANCWTMTEANAYRHMRNLMLVTEKLFHLREILKKMIAEKTADYENYCLEQLGFASSEIPQIKATVGQSLHKLISGGFPAYEIGEA